MFALIVAAFTGCKETPEGDETKVTFTSLTANGSATETTSLLTLKFSEDIADLSEGNIQIKPGTTGAVKGDLTSKGDGEYELTVADITAAGKIEVIIAKPGYIFSPKSKECNVSFNPILEELTGTVAIQGNIFIWSTLTADITDLNGTNTINYQWLRNDVEIEGANEATYIITPDDEGKTIKVVVSRVGYSGKITSDATNTIIKGSITGTVTIEGSAYIGFTLTANITALNGTSTPSYQWMRNGVDIEGATESTYVIAAEDAGMVIKVSVSREGYSGKKTSPETERVGKEPMSGSITIIGKAKVGEILSVDISKIISSGPYKFRWLRSGIVCGSGETYTVQDQDVNETLSVEVFNTKYTGVIESPETAIVIKYEVGDAGPAGGKIIYIAENADAGWQFIEMAPEDLPDTYSWAIGGVAYDSAVKTSPNYGAGLENTAAILALDPTAGAAEAANNYTQGDFSDWYLPTRNELGCMSVNYELLGLTKGTRYWSSYNLLGNLAYSVSISGTDGAVNESKLNFHKVRPVRRFKL